VDPSSNPALSGPESVGSCCTSWRCRTAGTLALEPGADALVQHSGPEWVDSVMVDGRWVMRGGVLLAFDEAAALADAEAAIAALHQRTARGISDGGGGRLRIADRRPRLARLVGYAEVRTDASS
jgi:hypothetical protein